MLNVGDLILATKIWNLQKQNKSVVARGEGWEKWVKVVKQ